MFNFVENPQPMPNRSGNKKYLTVLIHVIGWGLLFGFPFFFSGKHAQEMTWDRYLGFCMVPLSLAAVFYVNYFYLIEKFLFSRRIKKFVFFNLLLVAAVTLGLSLWHQAFAPPLHLKGPQDWKHHLAFVSRDTFSLVLAIGLSVAIRVTGNWYVSEARREELEKIRVEAELKNLRSQLNPHFLFNTLNNIYSLVALSPEKAQEGILELSRLLRYVLYEDNQNFVPLEKELGFICNYVELMRLRLPAHVEVETHIRQQEVQQGIRVAPLLFISLIENAFKHGISPNAPSFVRIGIYTEKQEKIICTIENSCFPKDDRDRSGSGIGLANLVKRLDLLYPDRYLFESEQKGGVYRSTLILNLKPRDL